MPKYPRATCTGYGGTKNYIPTPLKKKLMPLTIWPIVSYGSENVGLYLPRFYLKTVQNMINVVERWCYQRL